MQNNRRYDLSDRLIHFFRQVNLNDDEVNWQPGGEHEGNFSEDVVYSANFMMRCALRSGELYATWSVRGGVRTIYGPRPALCFTDMPTAAFLESSAARLRAGQKISTFALTFPKERMFAIGARPVIYSLHDASIPAPSGTGGGPRVFPESVLPLGEQYRYVTYSPTGSYRVDWTHEREWRWPHPEAERTRSEDEDSAPPPSLNIYACTIRDIGAIAKTRIDGGRVIHDMLCLVDRGIVTPDTFSYVLIAEEVTASAIRGRDEEEAALRAATINLNNFLAPQAGDKAIRDRVYAIAKEIEDAAGEPEAGEIGGCWLWFVDNTHQATRAFVNCRDEEERQVQINKDGKYLLFPYEFSDERSLSQREELTKELARRVEAEFGVKVGYFSVLANNNPNELPSYNSDMLENRMHYNWASEGLI